MHFRSFILLVVGLFSLSLAYARHSTMMGSIDTLDSLSSGLGFIGVITLFLGAYLEFRIYQQQKIEQRQRDHPELTKLK